MENESRFNKVLLNRDVTAYELSLYRRAAKVAGLHYEAMRPGERFIDPVTGRGTDVPLELHHIYITGSVKEGQEKLNAAIKAVEQAERRKIVQRLLNPYA